MLRRRRSRSAARSHPSRGQALVEFAIVAPLFFLVLFAIIESGRFLLYYETLNNATREGARYAIVNGANSLGCPTGPAALGSSPCDTYGLEVVARVQSAAFGVLGTGVVVTPTWYPDNGRGSTVTVVATYTYSTLISIVPLPPITISAESSLVVNN
jgi:Flp pilus assembly protein TadG